MPSSEQTAVRTKDAVVVLIDAFRDDSHEKKVNLCPGMYCDDNARTWVLPAVKKARELLLADPNFNHDVLPQQGYPAFVSAARQIAFGDTLNTRIITSIQTIGGTGANQFIARFMSDNHRPSTVWLSDPSWENHTQIWTYVNPEIEQCYYPYYDYKTSTLDIEGMTSTLHDRANSGDVLVLQTCGHNPTGLDLSREQWSRIAEICEDKKLFPVFDSAYQGIATGDTDEDAWAIRHFATRSYGMEFAVAQSFSKNFGLYGERVGALHIVTNDRDVAASVQDKLKKIARAEFTSAPCFGAKIIATVFETPALREQWQCDLKTISSRLRRMRRRLYDALVKRGTPGNWGHMLTDLGFFSMTGFSPEQVAVLRDSFHIYLLPTGRLAFTGLTEAAVEYVADSIHQVIVS
ncbi:aspartate aminotransferase-like protein [Nemania sp. FL0916]|nr:aspartate aminotransferase-like protein [Nemania sp. FL0916]